MWLFVFFICTLYLVYGDKYVGWKGGNQSRCAWIDRFFGSLYIMLKSCCRGEYEFDDDKVPRIYQLLNMLVYNHSIEKGRRWEVGWHGGIYIVKGNLRQGENCII